MGRTLLIAALGITLATGSARAQQVINIWPGVAPGSEHWTQKELTIPNTPVGTVIMNVVTPTLTAYLPSRDKATGTGVIIAPGGAFVALAITLEVTDMARWLQQRGIAAFVLKYRTIGKADRRYSRHGHGHRRPLSGIADGIQALKVVRRTPRNGESHSRPHWFPGILGRREWSPAGPASERRGRDGRISRR